MSDLILSKDQAAFTPAQVAALHALGISDATEGDLALFFHQAQRTGLDPFARQIYMIARRQRQGQGWVTKQTIQTGIDGFRLIARRAADARGETLSMDDTLWADPNGNWHDLWIWREPPAAAKVTVHVGNGRFSAVAATHEYLPTNHEGKPTGQWRTMPAVMIAKCAEALALRKAFPMDLSGLYTGEEMAQADAQQAQSVVESAPQPAEQTQRPEPALPVTDTQSAQIVEWADTLGLNQSRLAKACQWASNGRVDAPYSLWQHEAACLIDELQRQHNVAEAERKAPVEDVQAEIIDAEVEAQP